MDGDAMSLPWPWSRRRDPRTLALMPLPDGRWAWAHGSAGGALRSGVWTATGRAAGVRAEGLARCNVHAVLPMAQTQWLQIDAPAVQADEVRSAARWKVRELIDGRIDEFTLDVMGVGDERPRPQRQLFVAAARTGLVQGLAGQCREAGLELAVVELPETVQRNVQVAQARRLGLGTRATAALARHGGQALLTITAGDELFYARRLALDEAAAEPASAPQPLPTLDLDDVDMVDYGAEASASDSAEVPRLVVEVQRSFDVWERSWPELPLAALWLALGSEADAALTGPLRGALGVNIGPLELPPAAAELDPATEPARAIALHGALLRHDPPTL
jgi:MSHA biogenesis protein MshI